MHNRVFSMKLPSLLLATCLLTNYVVTLEINVLSEAMCVNQTEGCMDLDTALSNLTSNTVLNIARGQYTLRRSHHIFNLQNVSISGLLSDINCHGASGLSFVNIRGLVLRSLAIRNCSNQGKDFAASLDALSGVSTSFAIPPLMRVGLVLGNIEDLLMERVVIFNTQGLGLLAVNIMGNSTLIGTHYISNQSPQCNSEQTGEEIGGGARIFYVNSNNLQSVHLLIEGGNFLFNTDCGVTDFSQINALFYSDSYPITGGTGGGLSIVATQSSYSLNVLINDTGFRSNDARVGAGAYVHTFEGIANTEITFNNCQFTSNGQGQTSPQISYPPLSDIGAGLTIVNGGDRIVRRSSSESNTRGTWSDMVAVKMYSCDFMHNRASSRGGGLAAFVHSQALSPSPAELGEDSNTFESVTTSILWYLDNCTFYDNNSTYGSAVSFRQQVLHSVNGRVVAYIFDSKFEKNTFEEEMYLNIGNNFIYSDTAALEVISVILSIKNVVFKENDVSALLIDSSELTVYGNVTFEENRGYIGGGLNLQGISPIIYVIPSSRMTFKGNRATVKGGAISFDQIMTDNNILNNSDCFLLFTLCDNCTLSNVTARLEFTDNTAPLGGVLFGSTLENCPWAQDINSFDSNFLRYLHTEYSEVFYFDTIPTGMTQVATGAVTFDVVQTHSSVFPGQIIEVDVPPQDSFGQNIPTIVTADNSRNDNFEARVGVSGFYYISEQTPATPLYVSGQENQTVNVTLYTVDTFAVATVTLTIEPCPLGMEFNETENICVCLSDLPSTEITCHPEDFRYTVFNDYWIGLNNVPESEFKLIRGSCVFADCVTGDKEVYLPDYDTQCSSRFNKRGVLCGECKDGFSRVFGSFECRQCNSNNYLALIIPFAVSGIVLFLAIGIIGITIDQGWINSVFLFSNLATNFLTVCNPPTFVRFAFLPTALLSLQLGVPLCFHPNMTAVQAIGYEIIYLIYLHALIGIYAILCKRFSGILTYGISPVKTFVTLFIMAYFSMIDVCLSVLGAIQVHSADGQNYQIRWTVDPGQLYFHGNHAALGVFCILALLLYIVPISVLFLFPTHAYKHLPNRMKPFLDAVWGAYETKLRFWLGIQVWIRGIIPLLVYILPTGILLVVTAIILLVYLTIQSLIRPYKNNNINIVESLLMTDVIAIPVSLLYYTLYLVVSEEPDSSKITLYNGIFTSLCLGFAYTIFVGIFIKYLILRFPKLKNIKSCFRRSPKDGQLTLNTSESDQHLSEYRSSGVSEQFEATIHPHAPSSAVYGTSFSQSACMQLGTAESNRSAVVTKVKVNNVAATRPDYSRYRDSILNVFD